MPVVWQISVLNLTNKTLINGVLLNGIPFLFVKKTGTFQHAINVIKSYFIEVYGNKEISITANQKTITTSTDKFGSFSVVVDFPLNSDVLVRIAGNDEPLKILQNYPVVFQNTESRFDVISDIDDTIIVSHTADFFKRIGTLAFKTPLKRKAVNLSQRLFKEFGKQDARIFYVSKSESNLFGLIASIINHQNLPKGTLILTPYLNFKQLLKRKKGRNFKLDKIRFIIRNTGDKKYILMCDDSQRDMEIYYEIVQEFRERILKVYIRQTKRKIFPDQKAMGEKLKSLGVNPIYF